MKQLINLLQITTEETPLPHRREFRKECTKTNCEFYGNKPVCYMIFYEECKEYGN